MYVFRRRLRTAVIAWMLFQVVSLSALVPRACCDAHRPAQAERCHETADSSYCPMRAQGRHCPMHVAEKAAPRQGAHAHHGEAAEATSGHQHVSAQPATQDRASRDHASHAPAQHDQASTESSDRCRVVGSCDVPMTALAIILSNHGVVPAGIQLPADPERAPAPVHRHESPTSRLIPPDSPPPRA